MLRIASRSPASIRRPPFPHPRTSLLPAISRPRSSASRSPRTHATEPGRSSIAFENDAAAAGLAGFVQDNGTTVDRQLPEMACGGIGVLDYDGDGLLDVYAIQGGPFPPARRQSSTGGPAFPEPRRRNI